MKKKRGKYVLLGIVGIIITIIVINWRNISLLINFISKNTNDDTQVVENELAELKNPLLDIIDKKEDESESIDKDYENKQNDPSPKNTVHQKNTIKDNKIENSTTEKNKDELYLEILSKYNAKFEALQSEFEGQLDDMVIEGYKEYKSGNISKMKLANKYISLSKSLEKESDINFHQVLKEMEQELKENGFDTNIANDINSYYKDYKEKKKLDILAKGSKVE